MKILITGGTGMIGRHLIPALQKAGHHVIVVTRTPRNPGEIGWDDPFPAVDAAIHLAGERVNARRWKSPFLQELCRSRANTARRLRAKLTDSCRVVITASGANAYPWATPDTLPATEDTPVSPHTHLGRLCTQWEGAWNGFAGRVVALRIGFVISPDDSGIQQMLPLYKCGLGGVLGSGRQRMPWIAIDDLVRVIVLTLQDERFVGPVNVVSPNVTTFAQFNSAFARAVGRPAFWRIPGFVVRALFGRMADEMLLCDAPVEPRKLLEARFMWLTPSIDKALARAVGAKG